MLNELINDPIQAAISRLEKQHKEDKQGESLFSHLASFQKYICFYSRIGKTTNGI